MRFACLGDDPDALALARAVAAEPEAALVWIDRAAAAAAQAAPTLAPRAVVSAEWEDLLTQEPADAVIVGLASGRTAEDRADQLRKLAQEGVPLLVVHPVQDSVLFYFELDMIRQASQAPMMPYLPARLSPPVAELRRMIAGRAQGALGEVEQLVIERALADRSRAAVLAQVARDADLARHLCGELNKVSAMVPESAAAAEKDERFASLSAQMSGPRGLLVRWTVGPVETAPGGRLTLVGKRGKATLDMPARGLWTLEVRGEAGQRSAKYADWDPAGATLAAFLRALDDGAPLEPSWEDAVRAMELADAVAYSVERRRTVELHQEQASERSTFKGVMAAGGCLLLVAALGMVGIGLTLASLGWPIANYWPHALLGLLGVFLLLQTLRLVFPDGQRT